MDAENPLVVIGMDPHKRTVTIEVMTSHEQVVGGGRFATDADGYAQLLGYARQWPRRLWAVEGCAGIGKHVASRLVADGEEQLARHTSTNPALPAAAAQSAVTLPVICVSTPQSALGVSVSSSGSRCADTESAYFSITRRTSAQVV